MSRADRDPAAVSSYQIPKDRVNDLLYYETGFEQLHPWPEIVEWMTTQGYSYGRDWHCHKRGKSPIYTHTVGMDPAAAPIGFETGYVLEFPNSEIMMLFLLRWSRGAYKPTKHNWYGRRLDP